MSQSEYCHCGPEVSPSILYIPTTAPRKTCSNTEVAYGTHLINSNCNCLTLLFTRARTKRDFSSYVLEHTTVDGSIFPDIISDSVAYRLVLIALSVPLQPDSEQLARQRAKLASMGLTEVDQAIMTRQLGLFAVGFGELTRLPGERAADFQVRRDGILLFSSAYC
jgi:hypothetical protein